MKHIRELAYALIVAFRNPRVRALMGFTFTMIIIASVFYHYAEGWDMVDAVYFSVITLATIGYGDLAPHTTIGKLFTVGFVLTGLGIFVATVSAFAESMIETRRTEMDK